MQLGRKIAEGYAVDIADEPEFAEPEQELTEVTAEASSRAPLEPAQA